VPTPKVTYYAASRFAEQASFGATPELVAELQAKGFEAWIDEQMALPVTPIDAALADGIYQVPASEQIPLELTFTTDREVARRSIGAPDQLRWRVAFSTSNFIVAAFKTKGEVPGWIEWTNLLQRQAFANYGDTLREVTLNAYMAHFLDNDQNRPRSSACPQCAPNENYARELMQLFSIGVVRLAPDGTTLRDERGRPLPTYTQKDVEELARVLTGWQHDPDPADRHPRNWGNWTRPMVASPRPDDRDSGAKQVLGMDFPAGQGAARDLDDAIKVLMAHPNIGPFVALRYIQHLVTSNPSPAYVARVAARFRDNGAGVAGDMKAVLKAVLLDPEARRGDVPGAAHERDGKYRSPWLHTMAALRGMDCKDTLRQRNGLTLLVHGEPFSSSQSVFGYYAPTDRAPGSNLLAPEQQLVSMQELRSRLGFFSGLAHDPSSQGFKVDLLEAGGCNPGAFIDAYQRSPREFVERISQRYFRGAMSPALRNTLETQATRLQTQSRPPTWAALSLIDQALASAAFGVSR